MRAAGYVDAPSEYAKEGALAHRYAARWLLEPKKFFSAGQSMPTEMYRHLKAYVDAVGLVISKGTEEDWGDYTLYVETRVGAPQVHKDLWGSLDVAIYWPAVGFLWVCDLKYGGGRLVSVKKNPQVRLYAAYMTLRLMQEGQRVNEVIVGIFQPRIECEEGPLRIESVEPIELVHLLNAAREAALETEKPDAPLNPGPWCASTYCPVQATCPALKEMATRTAQSSFAHLLIKSPCTAVTLLTDCQAPGQCHIHGDAARSYDPHELARVLKEAPILLERIKAAKLFAESEARAGRPPPGFKLVAKELGPRKWNTDEKKVVDELGLKHPKFFTAPELRSPPQVDDLWKADGVKKDQREKLLAPLVKRESSGMVLVEESDERPAISRDAAKVFANLLTASDGSDDPGAEL